MVPLITYSAYLIQGSSVTEDPKDLSQKIIISLYLLHLVVIFPHRGIFPSEEGNFFRNRRKLEFGKISVDGSKRMPGRTENLLYLPLLLSA